METGVDTAGTATNECVCVWGYYMETAWDENGFYEYCLPCADKCGSCYEGSNGEACETCADEAGVDDLAARSNHNNGLVCACKAAHTWSESLKVCLPACANANEYPVDWVEGTPRTVTCDPCHASCASCTDGSSDSCLTCDTSAHMQGEPNEHGECKCIIGKYWNETTNACEDCLPGCTECIGIGYHDCMACPFPAFLSVEATADEIEDGICYGHCECPDNFYIEPASGLCVAATFHPSDCAAGEFHDASGACTACP